MFNHEIELVSDEQALQAVVERIAAAEVFALDIETINWWDRDAERVSLLQLGFREAGAMRVILVDTLACRDLEPLRSPLELSPRTKVIHNASFDAIKLQRHYRISTSPIHDTMLAARRGGEKRCSLKAQVETHLGFQLDKGEQRSDWSRRPLSEEQLRYAALDAVCTLLLYERQVALGMRGEYELRERPARAPAARSVLLPLTEAEPPPAEPPRPLPRAFEGEVEPAGLALLGIVAELSGRYSPEQLAVSVGSERVGLAGWIIDRILGPDRDLDEETARLEIAALRDRALIHLGPGRRLEATDLGSALWARSRQT